jgi:hypothetical protein
MMRRRRRAIAMLAGLELIAASILTFAVLAPNEPVGGPSGPRVDATSPAPTTRPEGGTLAPGSDPAVLPGPVLIADRGNNRLVEVDPHGRTVWEFPRPGDLAPQQTFEVPDDAFFTPDGREIVVTQEDNFVISVVDVATHRIVYRYGTPGVHGSTPNHLWNPDDALGLPGGAIFTADIKNCRLLLIARGATSPEREFGTPNRACRHQPPTRWGSPNGAFPMRNGHYLVTEINGDWVDELSLDGMVSNSIHPPGVVYPSDSNEVSPGTYLTVDYSKPGQIETFDRTGKLTWRFRPTGADALDRPSLALPLPNGDVLCNDDYNHRVIVVDPRTNAIVWQYGHLRTPGTQPGYLNIPDGVDLAPPHSLLIIHAATMGLP